MNIAVKIDGESYRTTLDAFIEDNVWGLTNAEIAALHESLRAGVATTLGTAPSVIVYPRSEA